MYSSTKMLIGLVICIGLSAANRYSDGSAARLMKMGHDKSAIDPLQHANRLDYPGFAAVAGFDDDYFYDDDYYDDDYFGDGYYDGEHNMNDYASIYNERMVKTDGFRPFAAQFEYDDFDDYYSDDEYDGGYYYDDYGSIGDENKEGPDRSAMFGAQFHYGKMDDIYGDIDYYEDGSFDDYGYYEKGGGSSSGNQGVTGSRGPLWMLFARHPGKSNKGYPKYDAAVSGFDGDTVKALGLNNWKVKDDALKLPYNGALQLAYILGIPKGKTLHVDRGTGQGHKTRRAIRGAGPNLKRIFAKIGSEKWSRLSDGDKAQSMFGTLKKLFESTSSKIRYETSDLRRAILEELALKKSFEGAFRSLRIRKPKFHILHSMGEIGSTVKVIKSYFVGGPGRSKRSVSLADEDIANFEQYLFDGLPVWLPLKWKKLLKNAKDKKAKLEQLKDEARAKDKKAAMIAYRPTVEYVKKKLKLVYTDQQGKKHVEKLRWPDLKDVSTQQSLNPNPKDYAKSGPGIPGDKSSPPDKSPLLTDWKHGVDLVIATGHGNWYKKLVKGFADTDTVSKKLDRSLDFCEFVLLKWGWDAKASDGKRLRIMDGYALGYKWYDLGKLAKSL